MTTTIDWHALTAAAREARTHAHAPYSRYAVGAALQADDGSIWAGCNVENRSLGLTLCAERTALGSAVAAGRRRFVALVVVTDADPPAAPCGLCRESLAEFVDDMPIRLADLETERDETTLAELLPKRFVLQV